MAPTLPGRSRAQSSPMQTHPIQPRPTALARLRARLAPPMLMAALALVACGKADSEQVGAVDTAFQWIGPDHKIVVEAYDDPKVAGVTCYVSRAKTGGVKGALGLAEDKAEASIACRQTGAIAFDASRPLKQQEEMFNERISLVFKRLRVIRMVDAKRNTLVYLTYSDRLIDGSPQNSVTAVPLPAGTPIPLSK